MVKHKLSKHTLFYNQNQLLEIYHNSANLLRNGKYLKKDLLSGTNPDIINQFLAVIGYNFL